MSLHLELARQLEAAFADRLDGPVDTRLDALIARLDNGVTLEARIAAIDAYAYTWIWGEAQLRIDTAPVHPQLTTRPNHLHAADGSLQADPLTRSGAEPWSNLQAVVTALLDNPLLAGTTPAA